MGLRIDPAAQMNVAQKIAVGPRYRSMTAGLSGIFGARPDALAAAHDTAEKS